MCSLCLAFVCVPGRPSSPLGPIHIPNPAPRTLSCVRAPSYAPSHFRYLCRVVSPSTPQGSLPRRKGLVWSPPFHLRIYDRLQDHLRRHLFQQVVVHCWPGYVRPLHIAFLFFLFFFALVF